MAVLYITGLISVPVYINSNRARNNIFNPGILDAIKACPELYILELSGLSGSEPVLMELLSVVSVHSSLCHLHLQHHASLKPSKFGLILVGTMGLESAFLHMTIESRNSAHEWHNLQQVFSVLATAPPCMTLKHSASEHILY